ncbi:molybdopterin molybdotransferase [Hymenobacter luteus]|uniref:Molybdopterin molybdenumtransferase n=2 Tax=Hymenobacter TaxID=89966 RepID=A0A7W9W9W8_9BACT|nr:MULTISPECIES: molybdopterin molybdotransferase MoeA [Hymenobacter]MBB4599556.1 molybdopterin molybdotransferase [Hymenobacter latericoloratus]MBB6058134.1 molybdopterin molybdotransferase [Hymenobacter luteus]
MLSVEDATRLVAATIRPLPVEYLSLPLAAGRILREDLRADRDFPPFNRVAMDGIALRFAAVEAGQTEFRIESTQFAGQPPTPLLDPEAAVEIMTGAALPKGVDTVIRYEDLTFRTDAAGQRYATVQAYPPRQGYNVHARAADRRQGDLLVPAGTRLEPAEVAVAATIGAATVAVTRRPRVAVVSTGDELVPITEQPAAHQIRRSNALMLQAAAWQAGAEAEAFHFNDDPEALRRGLPALLEGFDAVILSGGVSKGKADFLPETLRELGVEQVFHEVQQRPGKPFWFGRQPGGAVVFALPGNPVSTFVNFYRYARPWLLAVQHPETAETLSLPTTALLGGPVAAVLTEDVQFKPRLTHFLLVSLQPGPDGRLLATPERAGGSGDMASLLTSAGFLELPPEPEQFPAGTVLPAWRFR